MTPSTSAPRRPRSPSPIDLFDLDLETETTNEQMAFLTRADDDDELLGDGIGGETPPNGFGFSSLSLPRGAATGRGAGGVGGSLTRCPGMGVDGDGGRKRMNVQSTIPKNDAFTAFEETQPPSSALAAESPTGPVASDSWKQQKPLSINLARLPVAVLEGIVSHVTPLANIMNCMLVCKSWSKGAARALYRCPPISTLEKFHLLVQALLSPGTHSYASYVVNLHIPTALSEHLLMGDIDIALQLCPNIRGVKLEDCVSASNILLQSLTDHGRHLRRLHLRGCPISDVLISDLTRKCPRLEVVDLAHTRVTIASLCTLVDGCDRIRFIDLEACGPSPRTVAFDPRRTSTRPMRHLNLRNSGANDLHLRFAAQRCPDLSTVILEGCSALTDDAVIHLARTCGTSLMNLDASFCMQLTDLALRALAQHAKKLEVVTLSGCDQISPEGVQALTRGCPRLDEMVLHGCAKILASFVREYSSRQYELDCAVRGPAIKWLAGHRTDVVVKKEPVLLEVEGMVDVGAEVAGGKKKEQTVTMVDEMTQTDKDTQTNVALPTADAENGKDGEKDAKASGSGTDQTNPTDVLLKFAEAIAAGKWMPGGGFPPMAGAYGIPGAPPGSPGWPGGPMPPYGAGQWGPWGPPPYVAGYGQGQPPYNGQLSSPRREKESKRHSTMSDASTTSGYSSMRSSYMSTDSIGSNDGQGTGKRET
ncbi:hypothetical protein HK104_003860, partial [Borealophlyctis nickersoniae]